jgi:hypothetical protein
MSSTMDYRKHLIDLIETFAEAKGLSTSRVTTLVFNSGSVYRLLKDGKDITVGRLETAVRWFDTHWPADAVWPEGLARPSLVADAKALGAATDEAA